MNIRPILVFVNMLLLNISMNAQAPSDSLFNSFYKEFTQTAYFPMGRCGFGLPEYLSKDEILESTYKGFDQAGLNYEKNYWYQKDGISVYLDGYDPVEKIGFIFVDNYKKGRSFYGAHYLCLLYTSPSPRDQRGSRMPSSA